MRLGLADHFGWAIAVTADAEHRVVDRRRIELVEAGVTPAPMHYDSSRLDVAGTEALVATVRASIRRAVGAAFDALPSGIEEICLRDWPADFPTEIEVQRRSPWEARADAVMYRRLLAELAGERGWTVHRYDAKTAEARAREVLGERGDDVLDGPRARIGPPWAMDHRVALAATVLVG